MDIDLEEGLSGTEILKIVQDKVHRLDVTPQDSEDFLSRLIQQAERCCAESHDNRFGVYLTALGLTVRYMTQRQICVPFLPRLFLLFQCTLEHSDSSPSTLGLKMMSLRGCSRILEAYGSEVARNPTQIAFLSDWICEKFNRWIDSPEVFQAEITYFLPPIEEYLNVFLQAQPSAYDATFIQLVPLLLKLNPVDPQGCCSMTELYALFLKVSASPTCEKLFPVPCLLSSVQEMETDEFPSRQVSNLDLNWISLMDQLSVWIDNPKVRPHVLGLMSILVAFDAASFLSPSLDILLKLFGDVECSDEEQFYQFQLLVEAVAETLLASEARPIEEKTQILSIYHHLTQVMCLLKESLKSTKGNTKEIKKICSQIREATINALRAVIHALGDDFIPLFDAFMDNSFPYLADPLILGDLAFILRTHLPDNEKMLDRIVDYLVPAFQNITRYSKTACVRIVRALGRVASALGSVFCRHINLFIPHLMELLVNSGKDNLELEQQVLHTLLLFAADESSTSSWIQNLVRHLCDRSSSVVEVSRQIDTFEALLVLARNSKVSKADISACLENGCDDEYIVYLKDELRMVNEIVRRKS